jgi:hypothetical protein
MVKGLYCKSTHKLDKNKRKISKKFSDVKENINKNVNNFAGIVDNEVNKEVSKTKNKFMDIIYGFQYSWNNRYGSTMSSRPDLMFLYDLILVFLLVYVLHQILFRVIPLLIPLGKSPAYLRNLLKIPESKISMKTLEKQRIKIHATGEHDKFFRLRPYAPLTESDKMTMDNAMLMTQIMILFAIYFGIPFIIAYTIWFIVKYTKFFWRTAKGLFKTMFRYFFRLIKSAASRKWIIRTIMGWPKLPYPDMASEHLMPWKRSYIDPWIDREFLYYEILYRKIRQKYYYQPKRKYVEIPYAKLKLFLIQLKREYVDLTYREFWLLILETYPKFVTLPENELYLKLHGSDAYIKKYQKEVKDKLDENRRNLSETKGKCLGTSYESVSKVSGNKCTCPSGEPHSCGIISDIAQDAKIVDEELKNKFDCSKEHAIMDYKNVSGMTDFDNDFDDDNEEVIDSTGKKMFKIVITIIGVMIKIILVITVIMSLLMIGFRLFGIPENLKKYVVPSAVDSSSGKYVFKNTILSVLLGY